MRSSKGLRYSLILHGILLLLLVVGLPDFLHRKEDAEPMAISVDILPRSLKSNVRTQQKTEKTETKKPPQQKTERRPTPQAHPDQQTPPEKPEQVSARDVVKPPPPAPEPKPEPKPEPTPKPKPEHKPKPKPKPKPKQDDLSSILKDVAKTAKAEESKKPTEETSETEQHEAKSDSYDASQPLSMSEMDGLRQQVNSNWVFPAGAKDAANLKVSLHIEVAQDGTVTNVEFTGDKSRYASDSFFRAAVDSAIRAVHLSSPLKNLPPDKYDGRNGWHEINANFDPKDVLN